MKKSLQLGIQEVLKEVELEKIEDESMFLALFADIVPEKQKEKKWLKTAYQERIVQELYQIMKQGGQLTQIKANQLKSRLTDERLISPAESEMIVWNIWCGITGTDVEQLHFEEKAEDDSDYIIFYDGPDENLIDEIPDYDFGLSDSDGDTVKWTPPKTDEKGSTGKVLHQGGKGKTITLTGTQISYILGIVLVAILLLVGGYKLATKPKNGEELTMQAPSETINVEQREADVEQTERGMEDIASAENSDSLNNPSEPTRVIVDHVPTQDTDIATIYTNFNNDYSKMLEMTEDEVDMAKIQEKYVDCDIDGDAQIDHVYMTIDHENYGFKMRVEFADGTVLPIPEEGPDLFGIGFFCPVDLQWADIDSDGINEILIKYMMGGSVGVIGEGYLYKRAQDGSWFSLIDAYEDLVDCIDIELTSEGIMSLKNDGAKIGPFQYWDYMGTNNIINGNVLHEIERSKKIAKQYWPFEYWTYDTSNYVDHDFTVTDEMIASLKEQLGITGYTSVTVGNVFYHERRNVYLKEIRFFDSQGEMINYAFLDKDGNDINFEQY